MEDYKCKARQNIDLGWLDHATIQQFYSVLRSLYDLVSSTMKILRPCKDIASEGT